jgi:tetratricopeptide (TPR) repeat protein
MKKIIFVLLLVLIPAIMFAGDTAKSFLAEGRVDDAISTLQAQIRNAPQDDESHNLLCRAYYALQNWDAAISACQKAVELQPNSSTYHLWLGRAYGEKADVSNFLTAAGLAKKVRSEFEKAVQLSPNDVAARTDLAEFYLEAPGIVGGGKDKAAAQAETMSKLNPAKAHWISGRIAEKRKDYATAEQEYKAEIDSSHNSPEAWLDLALFYRHVNRLDEMQRAIAKATAAQTNQSEVLVDAAETLMRAGRDFPGAIEMLHRYLTSRATVEQAPAFKAHYLLGTLLEKQGDTQAAAQEYRTALSMAKSYSLAQQALSRLSR